MTDYTEKARNICRPSYSGASRVDDAQHVEDVATALREAHEAGRREHAQWRPIETAPKDGTQFQAWIEKYGWEPRARFNPDSEAFELWGRVDYDKDGWDVYSHMVPTHWMPLPTPPTAGGGDE